MCVYVHEYHLVAHVILDDKTGGVSKGLDRPDEQSEGQGQGVPLPFHRPALLVLRMLWARRRRRRRRQIYLGRTLIHGQRKRRRKWRLNWNGGYEKDIGTHELMRAQHYALDLA
jgi:hypothetical protein